MAFSNFNNGFKAAFPVKHAKDALEWLPWKFTTWIFTGNSTQPEWYHTKKTDLDILQSDIFYLHI